MKKKANCECVREFMEEQPPAYYSIYPNDECSVAKVVKGLSIAPLRLPLLYCPKCGTKYIIWEE